MRSRDRLPRTIIVWPCVLLLVSCCLGCGKDKYDRGTISGSVQFDGKPLDEGEIVFIPRDGTKGPVAKGRIIGGNYSMAGDGPVVGKHRVEIYAFRGTGKKIPDMSAKGRTNPQMVEERIMYLPAQYNDESVLIQEIQPGPNTANFDLKGPARR